MPEVITGAELSQEQRKKVAEFIEEEEGRFNRYVDPHRGTLLCNVALVPAIHGDLATHELRHQFDVL